MSAENLYLSNLNAICHVGGFFSIGKGAEWKMSTRSFGQNKFYFIKKGRCRITVDGIDYEGIPGRLFFIPSTAVHSYANDTSQSFAKHWIHFDVYPDNDSFFERMMLPVCVDVVENKSKIDKYFRDIYTALASKSTIDLFNGKAALFSLISSYTQMSCGEVLVSASTDETILKIVHYIDDNIDRSIELVELAELCHLHPTYFIKLFKKKTGETPMHFVQRRRIETAKRLIEQSAIPMNEIMRRVGIEDAAQFSKKFKYFYGSSPRDYRRDIRNMDMALKK